MKRMSRAALQLIALAACVALALAAAALMGDAPLSPLVWQRAFSPISAVGRTPGGDMLVIDGYGARLTHMDGDGTYVRSYAAPDGALFTAAAGSGRGAVFALCRAENFYVVRLGERMDVVAELPPGAYPFGLQCVGMEVYAVYAQGAAVFSRSVFREEGALPQNLPDMYRPPFPSQDVLDACVSADGAMWVLGRDGTVARLTVGDSYVACTAGEAGPGFGGGYMPVALAMSPQGPLLCNGGERDIGLLGQDRSYQRRMDARALRVSFGRAPLTGFEDVAWQDGIVAYQDGWVVFQTPDNRITLCRDGAAMPGWQAALKAAFLIACAAALALAAPFAVRGVRALFRKRVGHYLGMAVQLVVFVAVFGLITGSGILTGYRGWFNDMYAAGMQQTALLCSSLITRNGLVPQGGAPDAQQSAEIERILQNAAVLQEGVRVRLLTMRDGRAFVISDPQRRTSLLSPIAFEGDEERTRCEEAWGLKQLSVTALEDAQGRWASALSPVFSPNNEVVALLQMQGDLQAFDRQNASFLQGLALSVSSLVVVALFFFVEVSQLLEVLQQRRRSGAGVSRTAVRWMSFLFFTAVNMPMFFVPLQAEELLSQYGPSWLSLSMAQAAPLTAYMIAMGIAALTMGALADKRGWRPALCLGAAAAAAGYALSMLSRHIFLYTLGVAAAGFGCALCVMALQAFLFATDEGPGNQEENNRLMSLMNSGMYAGANCGVVFGSLLANRMSYAAVFALAIALFGGAAASALRLAPNLRPPVQQQEGAGMSLPRFLVRPRVLAFLLLLVPLTVLSFFVSQFLPIFGDMSGVPPELTSWGYLLNGIAIIYIGPAFTRALMKRLGSDGAVLVTTLLAIAGIAAFAAVPQIALAFACSVLLGLSDAGGQIARQDAFLNLPDSRRAGPGRALGAFSLMESLGQAVGPVVFTLIIASGVAPGMRTLLFVVIGCAAAYAAISLPGRRRASASSAQNLSA